MKRMNKIVIPTKEESHNLNNLMRFLLRRNDKVQLVFREMGFILPNRSYNNLSVVLKTGISKLNVATTAN